MHSTHVSAESCSLWQLFVSRSLIVHKNVPLERLRIATLFSFFHQEVTPFFDSDRLFDG